MAATTGIDFKLGFKETMSGALPKLERAARSAFGGIEGAAVKAVKAVKGVASAASKAIDDVTGLGNKGTRSMNELERAADRAARSVKKVGDAGRGSTGLTMTGQKGDKRNGFWGTVGAMGLGSLAAGAVMAAGSFAMDQGKAVVGSGMDAGRNRAQFDVLGKGAGAGLYSDVTKFVKDSIFGNEQYDLAKTELSYGIKAKDVLGDLKMEGDIAGGDREKQKSINYAYAQTYSIGRLQGDNQRQFTQAGFNPLEVISEHTGKSTAQLTKDMEAGKISADMVRQAMVWDTTGKGLHAGMLDKIGQTPFGKADAMGGNVKVAMQEMGEKLMPAFGTLLDKMKPLVDKLPDFLDKLVPYGEKLIAGFGDVLPTILDFGAGLGKVLKPIADFALSDPMKELAKNVMAAGSALSALVGGTLELAGKIAGAGVATANGTWEMIGAVMNRVEQLPGALVTAWDDWTGKKEKRDAAVAKLDYSTPGGAASNSQVMDMLSRGKITAGGFVADPAGKAKKAVATTTEASEASDSIVGGGQRQTVLHFHAPLYKVDKQVFENVGDMLKDMEPKVQELVLRILRSVPGAAF